MPEWITIAAAAGGYLLLGINLINQGRIAKKNSPNEIFKEETKVRLEEIEGSQTAIQRQLNSLEENHNNCQSTLMGKKLDNDNKRIKSMADAVESQQRIMTIMLEAQQVILGHLAEGNHKGELKAASNNIKACLIKEATIKKIDVSEVI
ncbi:MAG: hypothetical protein FWE14_04865 [Lachnospiraceae bacterium]|nr:hypothetical protein [Lachnospiraceae bacterium]